MRADLLEMQSLNPNYFNLKKHETQTQNTQPIETKIEKSVKIITMKIKIVTFASILLALSLILTACAGPTPTAALSTALPPQPPAAAATQTSLPAAVTSQPSATPTPAPTLTLTPTLPRPTENPLHSLGQLVKLQNLTLALIGVDYTQTQLQVTFAAKNTGSGVTSANFIDFSARAADGTELKPDACFTPSTKGPPDYALPSFGGSLQPGENLRGTICWKSADPKTSPIPKTGIQVSFTPEGSAKTAGTWDVSGVGNVEAPALLAVSEFATPPHTQGDGVPLKDIVITFEGVTFQGVGQDKTRVDLAHFTLENKGSGSYKFGNFLSTSFSLKRPDGSPLTIDFTTIGCQNSTMNVVIPAAQKRSFTLCFVNPGTSDLAQGSLVTFFPNPDQGDWVFWVTK